MELRVQMALQTRVEVEAVAQSLLDAQQQRTVVMAELEL